ncbi:PepSY domain-containing protein [Streptomyces coeruleoprunus]|uniref:PepSY domain-containing protein n=1 Tax=Streptomyces coeruleoprunus TaxID=285563 RepID=A0ABV9XC54_9ACTN
MKRNPVIATLTAAVLVGGGTYTAVAVSAADATPSLRTAADVVRSDDDEADDRDDARVDHRDDARADDRAAAAGSVSAAQAIAAALKASPGVVASAELDDDGGHWDVEVLGKGDRTHHLTVDSSKATVSHEADDDADDAEDRAESAALRSARVTAAQAAATALSGHSGATVTSVDFDDDGTWEVELRNADGSKKETRADAKAQRPAASNKAPDTARSSHHTPGDDDADDRTDD